MSTRRPTYHQCHACGWHTAWTEAVPTFVSGGGWAIAGILRCTTCESGHPINPVERQSVNSATQPAAQA